MRSSLLVAATLTVSVTFGAVQTADILIPHLLDGPEWQWRFGARQTAVATTRDAAVPPSIRPSTSGNGDGLGLLTYGDRLKVTFFESIGVAVTPDGASGSALAVFPRMDLSADYTVDETGRLDIPRLGQFIASTHTVPELQMDLAAAFRRVVGRTSDVRVDIVERQPVYVLGKVRLPGSIKHAPGMIVLQALAQAGGADMSMGDTSRTIEGIRESERLRQAEDKLDRLQAKRARLTALKNGWDTLAVPESIRSRLSEASQRDGLKALIEGEVATLAAERKSQELPLIERQIGIAQAEVEAVRNRGERLRTLQSWKTAKIHELEQVAARGNLPQFRLIEAKVEIADLQARQEDNKVALAQADLRLIEAELKRARLELEQSVSIIKEISATTQDIDDCVQSIASMRAVGNVLRNGNFDNGGPPTADVPGVMITRRVTDGFFVFPAEETTLLMPGDVIRMNSMPESPRAEAGGDGGSGTGRRKQEVSR